MHLKLRICWNWDIFCHTLCIIWEASHAAINLRLGHLWPVCCVLDMPGVHCWYSLSNFRVVILYFHDAVVLLSSKWRILFHSIIPSNRESVNRRFHYQYSCWLSWATKKYICFLYIINHCHYPLKFQQGMLVLT